LCATAPLGSGPDAWSGAPEVRAQQAGGSWMLDGICRRVPDAGSADWVLAFAGVDGTASPAVFAVPRDAAGLHIEPLQGWDGTRRFANLHLERLSLPAENRVDDPARLEQGLNLATALARLAIAAEQLGGAQQCLDLTVAYTATRWQFGRAIASFQAVKHRCAEMMVRLEAARSAVYGAAAFAAGGADPEALALECAAARVLASDTFFFCAQEAIQLHGGVGFTWEYDPQLYFKRAQASSHWLGNADALRENIAQALLA
jgi:acyl-CoA dehydrogenase